MVGPISNTWKINSYNLSKYRWLRHKQLNYGQKHEVLLDIGFGSLQILQAQWTSILCALCALMVWMLSPRARILFSFLCSLRTFRRVSFFLISGLLNEAPWRQLFMLVNKIGVTGGLYELDGRKKQPVYHGPSTQETLLKVVLLKKLMDFFRFLVWNCLWFICMQRNILQPSHNSLHMLLFYRIQWRQFRTSLPGPHSL